MFEIPALHPAVRAWLLEGPLAAFVPVYVARLKQGRYASGTVRRCLGALAHFAHWMALCRLPPTKLDESRVDQFLHDHLPHCGCPERAMRHPREAHAALMPLLAILRRQGVIAELPTPAGPIADELRRFEAHMRDARGLASGTCVSRLRIVERLLIHKFGGGALAFEALQPEDIRRFVAGQMELVNTTSNAATVNAALRAYLRWRATCGDAVQPLLAVIASPARWTLASLPRALKPEEVDRVLGSFTRTLRSPKRGYAIVRLALDLGLRTAEINRLQLDDIDWKQGTVVLRRTKSRRQDLLPLPAITGKALEAYVRYERPAVGGNRALFVRHLAPHDEPIGVHAIRRVVRDAFRRAGIAHGRAHALRHTLACRLVSLGSPIKEVADVLRHRSLNTALIYAKLNHRALTEVALPWPREQAMSARTSLTARMEQYLTERRRLGFELKHMGQSLGRFARYVKARAHRGPLTIELMASWARQAKGGRGERATAARALRMLRPFTRWLQQFEPSTEVPDEAIFGPVPGRVTPHIFQDEEIAALLEAVGRIGPPLSVRGAVMQTLFGLIACTGLRISEALALRDADVDLKAGVLTVRRGKFGKSRLVPLHPSAVAALARYRSERARFVPTEPQRPFFIGTRGRRLGQPVGERQAHRVFDQQRRQLGWIARGGHGAARIHDLRHSFAVRRLLCWHEQGVDVHARMLALSTYMGHAKICHTYWYLTAAPELMQLVGRRFEQFVGLPDDTGEEHAHG